VGADADIAVALDRCFATHDKLLDGDA